MIHTKVRFFEFDPRLLLTLDGMVPMRHGVAAVVVGDAVGNDIICPGSMSLEVVSCRVLAPIPRVTRAASKAQAAATSVLVCPPEHLPSSVSVPPVCPPSPPAEGEDAIDASRNFEFAAEGMSRADAPLLPAEFSKPLPQPTPRRMGVQPVGARDSRGRWYRWVEHPNAIARGHNRFMLCTCGWLVHLNSTGKAYARAHPSSRRGRFNGEVGEHDPASACTNYLCTQRADHRKYRLRHLRMQRDRRERVFSGDGIIVTIVG